MVSALRKPRIDAARVERLLRRQPLLPRPAHHRDWTIAAVIRRFEIQVALQSTVERQHVGKTPTIVAACRPTVEIFGNPAQKNFAVDRARATGHATTRYQHRLRL